MKTVPAPAKCFWGRRNERRPMTIRSSGSPPAGPVDIGPAIWPSGGTNRGPCVLIRTARRAGPGPKWRPARAKWRAGAGAVVGPDPLGRSYLFRRQLVCCFNSSGTRRRRRDNVRAGQVAGRRPRSMGPRPGSARLEIIKRPLSRPRLGQSKAIRLLRIKVLMFIQTAPSARRPAPARSTRRPGHFRSAHVLFEGLDVAARQLAAVTCRRRAD